MIQKYFLLFGLLLIMSHKLFAQWEQSDVISKGYIRAIDVLDNQIVLGGYNFTESLASIFYSEDCGNNWTRTDVDFPEGNLNSLIINDKYIFAGIGFEGGEVERSSDKGKSWVRLQELPIVGIWDLEFCGNNLFASLMSDYIWGEVWKSTDFGESWNRSWLGDPESWRNNCFAVIDSNIFVGTSGIGIYFSKDLGNTWLPANNGVPDTATVSALVSVDKKLFAGINTDANAEIYYSDTNGEIWTRADNGIYGIYIVYLETDGINVFAVISSRIFMLAEDSSEWHDIT
ncbi:MAG: hypothetical protein V1720_07050 [bacterium]